MRNIQAALITGVLLACSSAFAQANPISSLPGGSSFGGAHPNYTITVAPGAAVAANADILFDDTTDADQVRLLSIVAVTTTPTGLVFTPTAASLPNALAASQTLNLSGTIAASNAPGAYVFNVDYEDDEPLPGTQVTITLTITDVNPAMAQGAAATSGTGSGGSPFAPANQATGTTPALALADITDANTGQTLSMGTVTPGGNPSAVFNVTANSPGAGGTLTITATAGAALAGGDVGTHTFACQVLVNAAPTITCNLSITVTSSNVAPILGAPSGVVNLVVAGTDPTFTATCFVGENLAVTFNATDANGADTLTVTATRTAGSHATAAAAGFSGAFPATSVGTSPEAVTLAGTAAAAGTITFTVTVDDANGGTDTYTLAITISSPSITVTAPNGAESWTVGGNQNVTWTSGGVTGTVEIDLSTDGGGTFPISLANATANDGTQSIVVPNNPSALCRVRVSDSATALVLDASNANFTITTSPTITVTAPNGGENLSVGNNFNVTWTSGGTPGNVDILLSTDSGGTFPTVLLAATADDGTQTLVVPNNPSTLCRIRVEDAATGLIFDISNANFTIAVPAPAAVTMSAAGNPGSSNANSGSTKTALGFRLAETGGSSNFTVASVTVRVTTVNNTGGVAVAAVTAISLRRGGVLQSINNGGAGWSVAGDIITVNFTGLTSVVTAGGSGDFTVAISFSGSAVASPNPRYNAAIVPADVNGGASVTGANVTGGTITLIEELPDDPLDEKKKDDSCQLAAHGTPAWPMLAAGLLFAIVAMRRRRKA